MSKTAERVERGAQFLDRKVPGWHRYIDRDAIDMTTDEDCILGQLFGSYLTALRKWGWSGYESIRFGFNTSLFTSPFLHRKLVGLWDWEIEARQATESVPTDDLASVR